jgi:hypothetical protein
MLVGEQGAFVQSAIEVATKPFVEQARPGWVCRLVHFGQRSPDQLDGPWLVVDQVRRLGGPLQQGDAVE